MAKYMRPSRFHAPAWPPAPTDCGALFLAYPGTVVMRSPADGVRLPTKVGPLICPTAVLGSTLITPFRRNGGLSSTHSRRISGYHRLLRGESKTNGRNAP
jgi:hypothetical protein